MTIHCPRCGAHLLDHVIHLEDTPDGLYAVVDIPVVDHVIACRCGLDIAVASTCTTPVHPNQLTIIKGAA